VPAPSDLLVPLMYRFTQVRSSMLSLLAACSPVWLVVRALTGAVPHDQLDRRQAAVVEAEHEARRNAVAAPIGNGRRVQSCVRSLRRWGLTSLCSHLDAGRLAGQGASVCVRVAGCARICQLARPGGVTAVAAGGGCRGGAAVGRPRLERGQPLSMTPLCRAHLWEGHWRRRGWLWWSLLAWTCRGRTMCRAASVVLHGFVARTGCV
jgi:hypothetical protein